MKKANQNRAVPPSFESIRFRRNAVDSELEPRSPLSGVLRTMPLPVRQGRGCPKPADLITALQAGVALGRPRSPAEYELHRNTIRCDVLRVSLLEFENGKSLVLLHSSETDFFESERRKSFRESSAAKVPHVFIVAVFEILKCRLWIGSDLVHEG
jgi:hypothetical protein